MDAHFSKESEELKKSIEELFDKLERSKKSLDGFLETRGVKQENIYEIFQDEYNQYYKEWTIYRPVQRYNRLSYFPITREI